MHAALARLAERDREVLLLVEWEGLPPAELATVLGCREVTARGRLHRARRRFREAFAAVRRHDGDPAPPLSPPRTDGPATARNPGHPPPDPRRTVHLTTGTTMRKAQP